MESGERLLTRLAYNTLVQQNRKPVLGRIFKTNIELGWLLPAPR